jgi:hypothetical protein
MVPKLSPPTILSIVGGRALATFLVAFALAISLASPDFKPLVRIAGVMICGMRVPFTDVTAYTQEPLGLGESRLVAVEPVVLGVWDESVQQGGAPVQTIICLYY